MRICTHKPTWPNADYLKHEKPQTNQTLSVIQETAESLCYSQSPDNYEMRPFSNNVAFKPPNFAATNIQQILTIDSLALSTLGASGTHHKPALKTNEATCEPWHVLRPERFKKLSR
ncbi:hypothetical protein [Vibrio sp. TRT 17S01]|uniref:hypothetical protein n=1 Tax=Vibrio sp. TRT 17S01 TaxID=3418505 RepID=UPI003CF690E9